MIKSLSGVDVVGLSGDNINQINNGLLLSAVEHGRWNSFSWTLKQVVSCASNFSLRFELTLRLSGQ